MFNKYCFTIIFLSVFLFSFAKTDDSSVSKSKQIEKPLINEITLEEAKANIIKLIDENALTEKSGRKFKASFEGEFLRMIVLDRDGEEVNKGLLFDLSNVYKFDRLSLRKNNRAYVNIWTDRIRWPERTGKERMDKIKLIIRVESHEKAALLLEAFQQLNKVLPKNS